MVKIETEKFCTQLCWDLMPIAQRCWDERTEEKGETCAFVNARAIKIEPDTDRYISMANAGALLVVVLRDDAVIKGYALGVVHTSMHHKSTLCGFVDCLYTDPDYRSYAGLLAEQLEKEMKAKGVEIVGWPVHTNGPLYELAKAMKYRGDDTVMEKRL